LPSAFRTRDTQSADDAQRRVDQIRAFRAELAALRAAGNSPLSAEQEAQLSAYHDQLLAELARRYDVDASERAGQLSRGMRLLSFFGAVTLTAAIYSLVSHYWARLDLPLQATLLAAFPLMALVGVELSSRIERTLYIASLFAIVAYGSFWLALWELSDRLNIPLSAYLLWTGVIFGFALAIPYGFRIILAAALFTLAGTFAASFFQAAGTHWPLIVERVELLMIAAFSLLVLAIPLGRLDRSFAPVVRLVALGVGLACLLVLSAEGNTSLVPMRASVVEAIYQAIMLVVCVGVLVVSIRARWRETVKLASVMFALFLMTRYVDWFWDRLPAYVFFLVLAVLAFVWLLALRRIRARLVAVRS
jgi:hypothetical protein